MVKKQRKINITVPLDQNSIIAYALEVAKKKLEEALYPETQWDCTVFLSGFSKEGENLHLTYTYIPVRRKFN